MNAANELIQSVAGAISVIPEFTGALIVRSLDEIEVLLDADILFQKGITARKAGEYKEAIEWLEKALSVDPEHLPVLFELGYCHMGTRDVRVFLMAYFDGNIDAATERGIWYYKKYFELRSKNGEPDKDDSGAANNLGLLYSLLKNEAEEERYYRYAYALDGNDPVPICNLGIVCFCRDNLEEAERFYRLAIETDPGYANAYLMLGKLQNQQENEIDAIENFQAYLKHVDNDDVWEADAITFAKEYIESRTSQEVKKLPD